MAFIRWKRNTSGNQQAYLIHSYRGEDGKPRHKMLAYLGTETSLTPERLAELRLQHPNLKVDWEKIKPAEKLKIDISALSDAELLRKIRHLRHELGLDPRGMFWRLEKAGMTRCTGPYGLGFGLGNHEWGAVGPPTGKPVAPHVNSIQTSFDLNPGAVAIARI